MCFVGRFKFSVWLFSLWRHNLESLNWSNPGPSPHGPHHSVINSTHVPNYVPSTTLLNTVWIRGRPTHPDIEHVWNSASKFSTAVEFEILKIFFSIIWLLLNEKNVDWWRKRKAQKTFHFHLWPFSLYNKCPRLDGPSTFARSFTLTHFKSTLDLSHFEISNQDISKKFDWI